MSITKRNSELVEVPLCTCKKGTLEEQDDHKVFEVTECDDGETCNFCGYYVQFRTQADLNKTNIEFMELPHGNNRVGELS